MCTELLQSRLGQVPGPKSGFLGIVGVGLSTGLMPLTSLKQQRPSAEGLIYYTA